jgi:hypothetical protein
LTLQQAPMKSSTTVSSTTNLTGAEIENGLDFILSHFDQQDRLLFPRTIQTRKSNGKQIEVISKEQALTYFEDSNLIDCRANGFPSYTEYKGIQRYPPDLIFIDIDRSNFKDDTSFEYALSKTKKNIKEKLNGHSTINWSGNGYHILQPVECPILEQKEQFQKYQNKNNFFISQEFLRFAEKYLTNGKSDPNHHPSFKSCQIRVPGSINGRCLENREKRLSDNFKVKTLQKWNGVRPFVTREFIEDFRTYLEQKITDQENNNYNYNNKNNNQNQYSNSNHIEWIENKILQSPFSDYRKLIVGLILAPYLVVIKKLPYKESYRIINEWLIKCDSLSGRRLDFDPKYLINNNIKTSMKKLIPPISINKLETNYKSLYLLLLQDHNNNNNNNTMIN